MTTPCRCRFCGGRASQEVCESVHPDTQQRMIIVFVRCWRTAPHAGTRLLRTACPVDREEHPVGDLTNSPA